MRTVDLATAMQREQAIRVLWQTHAFDTAAIAALLSLGEPEVAQVVADRVPRAPPMAGLATPLPSWSQLSEAARSALESAMRRELEEDLVCLAGDVACRFYTAVRALPAPVRSFGDWR